MPGGPADFLRVLVVDDCPDTRMTLRLLLALWGHEVREAADGPAALEAAARFRPHVVLLDLVLPGLDGFEVARRLRRLSACEGARLAAISGYGREEDVARCREAGFDHHLLKPFSVAELGQLLADWAGSPSPTSP